MLTMAESMLASGNFMRDLDNLRNGANLNLVFRQDEYQRLRTNS